MTGYTFLKKYNESTKEQNIFLCTDIHFDSPAFDSKLLKKELDKAKKINADILIGGDVFDAILHGDRKRHTPSSDSLETARVDPKLNKIVQLAYEYLKPYARNIKAIGHGNHEMSVIKFNNYDPIDGLMYLMHTDDNVDIKALHYTGIIRYSYEHTGGGARRSFDIYYNHGQGASAEISKGLIMVDRHKKKVIADIYWFGHTHTKVILPSEPVIYMNDSGTLKSKETKAIITGCYNKTFVDTTDKEFVSVNFGEERMRTNQSRGGVLLTVINDKYGYEIKGSEM